MEGLEVSEISKSNLERTARLDAEFYQKINLSIEKVLLEKPTNNLTDLVKVSDGNHMAISDNFATSGIPYYRGQNIHHYFIEESKPIFIDEKTYDLPLMKRSHLSEGDVLLSIVGTIGGVSLVSSTNSATCNCKLAILRPTNVDGYFLSAFLKSKYGQNQIKKFTRGAVQMGLILEDMNQIKVPKASVEFQSRIRKIIQYAKEKSAETILTYSKAEQILFHELGLSSFEISNDPINIKSFKNSFGKTSRLDAEYYQLKYEQVVGKIMGSEYQYLKDIVGISKSIEPGSNLYSEDGGLPFYRVADISKFGLSEPSKKINGDFIKENNRLIETLKPKKGTILFSKDGSVGTGYLLREDLDGITSGALLHLKVLDDKLIIPEYLTLALNSKLIQMQAERDAGGSIILHWRKEEIENVVVPIISYRWQKKIASLVDKSFNLKKESEELLKIAELAVEINIENGEQAAIEFILANT